MHHKRQQLVSDLVHIALQAAQTHSSAKVICLSGEAGIGKSTILEQLQAELLATAPLDNKQLVVGSTLCSAPLAGVQLGSVEALQPWAALLGAMMQNAKSRNVGALVKDLAKAWIKFIPVVGDIIESTADTLEVIKEHRGSTILQRSDEAEALNQQQVFQQYINVLSKMAENARVVLIIDDAHWADESSLNLLFTAARQLKERDLCFILAHRDASTLAPRSTDSHPLLTIRNELQRYDLLVDVNVPAMNADDIDVMFRERYGEQYKNNDELESFVARSGGGNPLFISSWMKELESEGIVDAQTGSLERSFDDIHIPQTVRSVLEQRLSRLAPETHDLLRYASVEGDVFSVKVLTTVTESTSLKILQQLRHIETETALIRNQGKSVLIDTETTVFSFTHTMVREILYQSLLEEERELIHQIVLDQMHVAWENPEIGTERRATLAPRLALHAGVVGQHRLAAQAWLELARASWKRYSRSETRTALEHARESVEHMNDVDKNVDKDIDAQLHDLRAGIFELNAEVLIMETNFEQALVQLKAAAGEYSAAAREQEEIDCLIRIASTESRRSNVPAALIAGEFSLGRAKALHYDAGISSALSLLGILHETVGAFDEAEQCYREAIVLAEKTGQINRRATAVSNLGRLQMVLSRADDAFATIQQAIELFQSIDHIPGQSRALNLLGILYKDREEYDKAVETITRAMSLNEQIGDADASASNNTNIGVILFDQGRFEEALSYFKRSVSLKEQLHDVLGLGIALHGYASCLDQVGLNSEALEQHQRSLSIFTEMGEAMWMANAEYGLGMHYLFERDFSEAEQLLAHALDRAESIHAEQSITMIRRGMEELAAERASTQSPSDN